MANLFNLDGGPYRYLEFKKVIPVNVLVVYIVLTSIGIKSSDLGVGFICSLIVVILFVIFI